MDIEIPGLEGELEMDGYERGDEAEVEEPQEIDPHTLPPSVQLPDHKDQHTLDNFNGESPTCFLTGQAGTGKCLGKGTPVMLFDGTIIPVEQVYVGAELMGPDSKPRLVLSTNQGVGPLIRITPTKGDSWICNDVHILTLKGSNHNKGKIADIAIPDLEPTSWRHWKLFRVPVEFSTGYPTPVDPYVLGTWIGDGTKVRAEWNLGEGKRAVADYIRAYVEGLGSSLIEIPDPRNNNILWRIPKGEGNKLLGHFHKFSIGSGNVRRLAVEYKCNSREVRMAVLAGLLDTDGASNGGGGADLIMKDATLCADILYLARSLGFAAYSTIKEVQLEGWDSSRPYHRISISGDLSVLPTLRLKFSPRKQIKDHLVTGWRLEPIGKGEYYGFTLAGDGRFLLGDFTVTHNTFLVRQHIYHDPSFACLAATTGIASINLGAGVATIHSLLGFGNTQGAEDSYTSGNMLRKLRMVGEQGFRWIVVDEASMLHYKVLDNIMLALDDYNQTYEGRSSSWNPLGLMLTGDCCQLSPVPDKLIAEGGKYVTSKKGREINEPTPWLFKAECWERFANNTIKLTEIRRQSDATFIEALNAARRGDGKKAVEALKAAGVQFKHLLDGKFDGTTVVATNAEVDRFNNSALLRVEGEKFEISSERWCAKQYPPSEWKNIPEKAKLKVGALVMILQNDQAGMGKVRQYVNGDLAHVVGVVREPHFAEGPIDPDSPFNENPGLGQVFIPPGGEEVLAVEVKLVRTRENVIIGKVTRPVYQLNEPDLDYIPPGPNKAKIRKDRVPGMQRRVWIMGELDYIPLRLAYASTVHKMQGLTVDRVQVHPKDWFFGQPQMAYVSLSRCRTAQGLIIVGGEKLLESKITTDPILAGWM